MHEIIIPSLFAISAATIPIIVNFCVKQRYKLKFKQLQNNMSCNLDNSSYQCIFWTIKDQKCSSHLYHGTECEDDCSTTKLNTLLKLLNSAKYSISMCMYCLTLNQVKKELILAEERGVIVRIITDYVTCRMQHSKIRVLKDRFGYDIRAPPYDNSLMHHKYCLIDAEDTEQHVMWFGSLNLTLQACTKNFECICITNNPKIIKRCNEEFEYLWKTYENES